MLKHVTTIFVIAVVASSLATAEPTCEETLEACDFYVEKLEQEQDTAEQVIKTQTEKIKLLEKEQQNWFFFCSDKITCTLVGVVLGAVVWEAVR
jgi:hypothetical protein